MPALILASTFSTIVIVVFFVGAIGILLLRFVLPRRRSDTSPHPVPPEESDVEPPDARIGSDRDIR